MTEPPIRLLLVDPDPASAFLLQQALDSEGFAVSTCTDADAASDSLAHGQGLQLLLLDCLLSERGLARLIQQAHASVQRLPVLLLCLGATGPSCAAPSWSRPRARSCAWQPPGSCWS